MRARFTDWADVRGGGEWGKYPRPCDLKLQERQKCLLAANTTGIVIFLIMYNAKKKMSKKKKKRSST